MARVLVVDDEAAIACLLESYLSACGHDVTSARSSLGTLGWLDSAQFDVVVLDIMMPGPLDGIDVCRTLKSDARSSCTRVLVISGVPSNEAAAYAAGADAFMAKPFSLEQIRSCVLSLAAHESASLPDHTTLTVRGAIDSYNERKPFTGTTETGSLILPSAS